MWNKTINSTMRLVVETIFLFGPVGGKQKKALKKRTIVSGWNQSRDSSILNLHPS